MVSLYRCRHLPNQLFQYCFARILAHRFGYRLNATPHSTFPGTYTEVDGEHVFGPIVTWSGQWPFDSRNYRPLTFSDFRTAPGCQITLAGAFQRFDLIADFRDVIRNDWLRVVEAPPTRSNRDFLISLLPGDDPADGSIRVNGSPKVDSRVTPEDGALTADEVRRLVRSVSHDKLYFVSNQPNGPLLSELRDLNAEVVGLTTFSDFLFARSFQKIAIGQNALLWWAGFLGDTKEIYFPPCDRGIWSHPEPAQVANEPAHFGISLRVDEPRYIYDW